MALKTRVHNGCLLVDEPTALPESTEVDLLPLDPGDWLDPADRAALHKALSASQDDVEAGRLFDAEEVLRDCGLCDSAQGSFHCDSPRARSAPQGVVAGEFGEARDP
jgi:hypothetical protein